MMRQLSERNFGRWLTHCSVGLAVLIFGSLPQAAYADEDGVSFWLPGASGTANFLTSGRI
jgi:hypothetical protein